MLEPGSSEASRTRQGRDQANRYDVGLVIACILSWLFVHVSTGMSRKRMYALARTHISGATFQDAHFRAYIAGCTSRSKQHRVRSSRMAGHI